MNAKSARIALSSIIAVFLLLASCGTEDKVSSGSFGSTVTQPYIELSGDGLRYDGVLFPLPCLVEILEKALGMSSRTSTKANTILVWDDLGVFAYVKPGGNAVFTFSVALAEQKLNHCPRKVFAGKVKINGSYLQNGSDVRALKQLGFTQSKLIPVYWELLSEPLLVTAVSGTDDDVVREVGLCVPVKEERH